MKQGALNIVSEPGDGMPANPPVLESTEENRTLRSTIRLKNSHQTTFDGLTVWVGEVLREELIEAEPNRIGMDGSLDTVSAEKERQVSITRFIYVEDRFLITQRTDADEARRIVEEITSAEISSAEIDIGEFATDNPDALPFLVWARAEDLTLCATGDLNSHQDIRDRVNTESRPQMSFRHLPWNGCDLNGTITESGYVEIYQDERGSQIGTVEYTRFVLEVISNYVKLAT